MTANAIHIDYAVNALTRLRDDFMANVERPDDQRAHEAWLNARTDIELALSSMVILQVREMESGSIR